MKESPPIWFLWLFLAGLLLAIYLTPLHQKHFEKEKYTIQFCDKETEEAIKTINNAEFRLLNKDDIMYGVKINVEGKEQEVLVLDKVPSNCFLIVTKEPK